MATLPLLLATCNRLFDNPVDPGGSNYQGYDTVGSPDEVSLVSPIPGASFAQGDAIPLVVSQVLSASEYQVQVSLTPDPFDDGIVFETSGETHTIEIPWNATFPGYFSWRARARVGSGEWGQWSEAGWYNVLVQAPIIASWQTLASLPSSPVGHTSVAFGGYLYVIGGSSLADVIYAPINANGTLGGWLVATPLSSARQFHASVACGDYLYVIGGDDDAWNATADVFRARVNPDGTVGSWQSTSSLPSARGFHAATISGAFLYVLGGQGDDSVALSDVLYAEIVQ